MALPVVAITLDFGNTLVRVRRADLQAVVLDTAASLARQGIVGDPEAFRAAWTEERDRQFREDVPEFREVDLEQRSVRVVARLRGMSPPPPDERWDDARAARFTAAGEVGAIVDAYSLAFVHRMTPEPDAGTVLRDLAERGFPLAILSNWPLALTIDRYVESRGWSPYLRANVVSHRVGTIKPHPGIFRAAEEALGIGPVDRGAILHVGDDWAADVVGARKAGWRVAYLHGRQDDTPLPTSGPSDGEADGLRPDLVLDDLAELPALVEPAQRAGAGARPAPEPVGEVGDHGPA